MYTVALLHSQLSVRSTLRVTALQLSKVEQGMVVILSVWSTLRVTALQLSKPEQDMVITLRSRVSLFGAGSPHRGQWLLLVLLVHVHCLGMQPPSPAVPTVTVVVVFTHHNAIMIAL